MWSVRSLSKARKQKLKEVLNKKRMRKSIPEHLYYIILALPAHST